jgi:serine protease Do
MPTGASLDEQEFASCPTSFPFLRRALRSSTLLALVLGLACSVAPARTLAFGAPESFADLADKISPAVVNITTSAVIAAPADGGPMVPEGQPVRGFLR